MFAAASSSVSQYEPEANNHRHHAQLILKRSNDSFDLCGFSLGTIAPLAELP